MRARTTARKEGIETVTQDLMQCRNLEEMRYTFAYTKASDIPHGFAGRNTEPKYSQEQPKARRD